MIEHTVMHEATAPRVRWFKRTDGSDVHYRFDGTSHWTWHSKKLSEGKFLVDNCMQGQPDVLYADMMAAVAQVWIEEVEGYGE